MEASQGDDSSLDWGGVDGAVETNKSIVDDGTSTMTKQDRCCVRAVKQLFLREENEA